MPRKARLELPGVPMHVTQRGVNHCAIFTDDEDRHHFRQLLHTACRRHSVAVHAFVLMDNHVHLLMTGLHTGDISRTMRRTGQAYVQAFNARHGRSGTLWQSRFKSCLVDTDAYLLTVIRYIELNPVRAAMVDRPEAWRWSSVHAHLGIANDPLVIPHPSWLALAATPADRSLAHREWLDLGITPEDQARIRRHIAQERALGSPRFQAMVEEALGRPASCRNRGRPPKRHGKLSE